ncbi:hypothetical protein BDR06DRAFT_1067149, partial [Suillus hirtellus]
MVTDHHGVGPDTLFEVKYSTGDKVWFPYHQVSCLEALSQYLEALGVPGITHLPKKISTPSTTIPVSTIDQFSAARQSVFGIVDRMVNNFASVSRLSRLQ